MARQEHKITVTLMSGERTEISILPTHTAQDIVAVLIQDGKLPAQDNQGHVLQYEVLNDRTMTALAGEKPLVDQGITNGAELRIKPGSRVAAGVARW